jgi:hypothetical protein
MKKIAICQSNYIPWKGYFDLINCADEFILYDDMQYTKRDWRNRNRIKTPTGLKWLTIPVRTKGKYYQKIKDVEIMGDTWKKRHWYILKENYKNSRCFHLYSDYFETLYLSCSENLLSKVNYYFINAICELLGIKTKISWSMDYEIIEGKTERLVDLCLQAKGNFYITGPSAKNYIEASLFSQHGIHLEYMDYSKYKEYRQLNETFEHGVSIIDLIFNEGKNAHQYMTSF